MRAVLFGSFRWDSVSRLYFYTVTNSKDVPCFMEVFVNSSTGGVSVLLECLQVLVLFVILGFFWRLRGCAWVWVCVHAGVRVLRAFSGTPRCIFLYKLELESGSVA